MNNFFGHVKYFDISILLAFFQLTFVCFSGGRQRVFMVGIDEDDVSWFEGRDELQGRVEIRPLQNLIQKLYPKRLKRLVFCLQ